MIKNACDAPQKRTASFAKLLLTSLNAIDLAELVTSDNLLELVNAELTPSDYELDPSDFRDRYHAVEAFSKCNFEIPGINREATAYEKFFIAEEGCRRSNERLVEFESRVDLDQKVWRRARALVASVLGDFSWDDAIRYCSFGPGATTSLRKRDSSKPNKWEYGTHVTANCLPLALAWQKLTPGYDNYSFTVVAGNKVTTVPKNAKTDRVIAIEPDWNMFFQRGIGGAIRHRLRKRCGILHSNSQQVHKDLAREGSLTGRLATIDLQAASDSVSLALCEALLPKDWMDALLVTRSHQGTVLGETIVYEKISSMGNGYTFELETLLFWALAKAIVGNGSVSVYGDDIIIPTDFAEGLINLLAAAGFSTNSKKTFTSGPFRESCGGHYFAGHDVTPPYFKHLLDCEHEYIHYANRVSHAASQRYGFSRDGKYEPCYNWLICKGRVRYFGPYEAGDSVVHIPFDLRELGWSRFQNRAPWPLVSYQQWQVKGLLTKRERSTIGPRSEEREVFDKWGAVLASIFPEAPVETSYELSHRTKRYVGKIHVPSWTGPGPWVTTG